MGIQINGQTDTITAIDGGLNVSGADLGSASAGSLNVTGIVTASGFSGNITGNVLGNVTGNLSGNVTGNLNSSGVSTLTTLRATSVVGVNTLGVTTAYVGSVNDGPISGARNKIINGAMEIDQRNNGASVTQNGSGLFAVDRFKLNGHSSDGVFTGQRSGVVPVGFTSSLLITITTADASIGASQEYFVNQHIEGSNITDLNWSSSNAKTVTLSFWVRSSVTGNFGGAFKNNGATRCYPYSYTINSANTWEYKTITIPGDTTGTWATDTSSGIEVYFSLGVGSSRKGTANTWAASNLSAPTSSVDLISTLNATLYITGVQLEVGTVATPFERRSYGQELALCQRYYCQSTNSVAASSLYNQSDGVYLAAFNYSNASWVGGSTNFPVSMRTTPSTVNIYTTSPATTTTAGNASHYQAAISWGVSDASVHENTNERSLSIIAGGSGRGSTGGSLIQFNFTASAEL